MRANSKKLQRIVGLITWFAFFTGSVYAFAASPVNPPSFMVPIITLLLRCEADLDHDDLCDENEDPCVDQDQDQICMRDEVEHGLDPDDPSDATEDWDDDEINNRDEINNGLDPNNPHDADEDADEDGLTNIEEINTHHTDPQKADTDDDGVDDKVELALSMDPKIPGDDLGGITEADKHRIHVMNRLTFGPSATLNNEIVAMGLEEWISNQLQTVPMPAKGSFTEEEDPAQYHRDNQEIRHSYQTETMAGMRPLESPHHLQTLMGVFWDNHFNTYQGSHNRGAMELYDEDRFFENALGNFYTLLELSAKSYTMSVYLNGNTNVEEKPNENYAREVMELHTVGIDGGYTHEDIAQLARIFTGWHYSHQGDYSRYDIYSGSNYSEPNSRIYKFFFRHWDHDDGTEDWNGDGQPDGDKVLLGQTILSRTGADGVLEGEEALTLLARHDATAQFICKKLAQRFISDAPSQDTVDSCAITFSTHHESTDQIAQVLATLFTSDEFNNPASRRNKSKDIQEYIIGLGRLLEWDGTHGNKESTSSIPCQSDQKTVGCRAERAGQGFFKQQPPIGWPEPSEAWINTGSALETMVHANQMIFEMSADSDPVSLVDYFNNHGNTQLADIIRHLFLFMLGGEYDAIDINLAYDLLQPEHEAFDIDGTDAEDQLRKLVAQFAASPKYHLQ